MNKIRKKKSVGIKILKWFSIVFLVIIISLIAIPYFFKDKIVEMVSKTINNNVNATVTFTESDLSFIKHFPLASLSVSNVTVANKTPFVGDTLFYSEQLSLDMNITELFKKPDESIAIKSIASNNGAIHIIFNKEGQGNFDIAKKSDEKATTNTESSFSFNINNYELENIDFSYTDRDSNTKLNIDSIYHTGKGNFKQDIFNLDTKSTGFLSFSLDKTNFINSVKISLDAVLEMDLKNSKYTFKENTGYVNQLPLAFDGFIQLVDDTQLYDLHFKTPTSSFKNALALMPKQYSGNLKTIKTEGNFDLEGIVKGTLSETTIPGFEINLSSKNAMFKYADLPKSVEKINITSKIINKTGFTKDTYLTIHQLNFKIDDDVFDANGSIKNMTTNPLINLKAKGTINLANIGKVYPAPLEKELVGILNADIATNFDMNSIEKENYKNIKNAGEITVKHFKYEGKDVANPFYINKTKISFNTNTISLNEFDAKTGTSDLSIKGNLDNFYGFIFKDEVLKGNFSLNSNTLKIANFLTTEETSATQNDNSSTLKIPAFLDVKISANAKKVMYDNINLANVSGSLFIHDEMVDLKNLKTDIFGGNIGFDGNVSTKGKAPKFNMKLNLKELNITDSFGSLEMLKSIAPIAKTIEGKINSTINLSGRLDKNMSPNLATLSGDLFGKLLNPQINKGNSKVLSLLGEKVDFINPDKLNLDGINALISFENGQVNLKPIPIKYKDVGITISGNHSFDQSMNYDIVFDVPVKYLGTEVTNLIAKLSPKDAAEIKSIPVKGNVTGSFGSPNFSSNIKGATSTLVKNLIEKQKNNLIGKGKEKLNDKLKGVLGGLFGKKKKDTVKNKN